MAYAVPEGVGLWLRKGRPVLSLEGDLGSCCNAHCRDPSSSPSQHKTVPFAHCLPIRIATRGGLDLLRLIDRRVSPCAIAHWLGTHPAVPTECPSGDHLCSGKVEKLPHERAQDAQQELWQEVAPQSTQSDGTTCRCRAQFTGRTPIAEATESAGAILGHTTPRERRGAAEEK